MGWQELIGQSRALETLRRALRSGRLGHAYLFYGPSGAGTEPAALLMARALQCRRGEPDPCDECTACRKVRALVHPDVHVLFPAPTDASEEEIAERRARLAEDPYAELDFSQRQAEGDRARNRQVLYSVAVIEALRRRLYLRPHEGRYQVVLLLAAEALRQEAANALLKILEEPPEATLFVLTTSRPDRLLPTIVSRCQKVRFDPLAEEDVVAALRARGLEPEEAISLARIAAGNLSRALALRQAAWRVEREAVLAWLRTAASGRWMELARHAEEAQRLNREQLKDRLQVLLFWLRDLWRYGHNPDPQGLYYPDQVEVFARFHAKLPEADLEAMIQATEDALRAIERNGNALLVSMALSLRLRRAMRGQALQAQPIAGGLEA
ncbi:MAG: DNA polymerase III subunit delta' [Bacteroidetes bacterium]|nr:DNA polymerase III subunit delta' [Rhodothermia bacterium]MCS7155024.1 DNA polymerase III subunit delta' [Bacteroidota bacterium]MCX7907308.1 DNA polymerase III subunit delta' [Bacteroidota bacterium]MDW8137965.1 DNA polymerase III subunit delta' [Bacteroidota bacterium]MDW8286183.1 DNA polymerase III subunit delta' [Bacteroidota bacterium]